MAKRSETREKGATGASEMNLDLCREGKGRVGWSSVGWGQIDFHLNTSHSQDLAGCSHGNSVPSLDCVYVCV